LITNFSFDNFKNEIYRMKIKYMEFILEHHL